MLSYIAVKNAHIAFAALSGTGFLLRGWWMWRDSPLLGRRLTRTLPHINDSLLLAAAVWLVVQSAQYPLAQTWLTAKLAALLVYIVLGSIALKRGRTRQVRAAAFGGALAAFAYIVAVALRHHPWPFPM